MHIELKKKKNNPYPIASQNKERIILHQYGLGRVRVPNNKFLHRAITKGPCHSEDT